MLCTAAAYRCHSSPLLLNSSNAAADSGESIMASNIALKRAAKANRRKAVVAEKRKLELLHDTLAARVLRAAHAPIRHCFAPEMPFESGMGTVILARGISPDHLTLGVFLVDTWCLGVKDTHFRSIDGETFEAMIATLDDTMPIASVDPSYARKLLRDATAWAQSMGIAPHRDFAAIERLFGDISADACDATFRFGRDGEPFYVQGPRESPAQVCVRFGGLGLPLAIEAPESADPHEGRAAEL
jgi:hypothetical protein